ncbi:MAG: YdcF family protein [Halioglobus sp.]|nr:YdcF family protein [Halioglobus sp.]
MDPFLAAKLASLVIYPLSFSLFLALLALLLFLLRWRRAATALCCFAFAWLYAFSTATVANSLTDYLEAPYPPKVMSVVPLSEAIVLLGGATRGDTHRARAPDLNQRADRLLHAVALYKQSKAPLVVVSGGSPVGGRSEAAQMRDLLLLMGVPLSAMQLERQSRNTRENALYVGEMLRERGVRRILLVTSAFHMRRAVPLFEKQGLEVVPAPTDFQRLVDNSLVPGWLPGVGNLARSSEALHEIIGFWYYRWRGWL